MSTYTPIESITLTSATPKVTFSSIPQNYTDIIMVGVITNSASQIYGAIQFNTDNVGSSSTKYSVTSLANWQNNPYSDRQTNTYGIATWEKTVSGTDDTAVITITVKDYSSTAKYKTAMARVAGTHVNLSGNNIGVWRSYEAVNSISFDTANGNNFGIGCTFTLYGVQSGNSSAKASGGNIVTTDGSYWYHAFTSSGTFIPSSALTADVLVVAGGGGGAGDVGGGGGAGGVLYASAKSLASNTAYTCIIGAGGVKGIQGGTDPGTSGGDSYFDVLKAFGGAYGAGAYVNGIAGGSGAGGGGGTNTTGGSSNQTSNNGGTGYGNAGGGGGGSGNTGAGGGGGAGAAGSTASGSNGGNGGAGLNTWSSWASATGTGVSGYYAGGGGGGAWGGSTSTGGSGGGGNGGQRSSSTNGGDAVANTGSGGGGDGGGSPVGTGGNGGSGIIIIRYAV